MASIEVTDERAAPGPGPAGLAWDGRYLWNADFDAGRIYCLEPATGQVVDSLLCPGVVSGLTSDGAWLWVGVMDEGLLHAINPATHDFDRTLEVEDAGRLAGMAWDGSVLWAVSQRPGRLLAVDVGTGEVRRTLSVPVAGGGLAYREGRLWLGAPDAMRFNPETFDFEWVSDEGQAPSEAYALLQIEADSGRTVARLAVGFLPMGLAWLDGKLWMARARPAGLVRARVV